MRYFGLSLLAKSRSSLPNCVVEVRKSSMGMPCCKLEEKDTDLVAMTLFAEEISEGRYGTLGSSQNGNLPFSEGTYLEFEEEVLEISRA